MQVLRERSSRCRRRWTRRTDPQNLTQQGAKAGEHVRKALSASKRVQLTVVPSMEYYDCLTIICSSFCSAAFLDRTQRQGVAGLNHRGRRSPSGSRTR